MRIQLFAMTMLMIAVQAFGQATGASMPAMKNLATSADVQALIAKARSELKAGDPYKGETIVKLDPYTVALEYRASRVPPSIHETEAELFYVIEGSRTLTVGGALMDEHRTNPSNLGGASIQGGTDYSLTTGDFYFVPEGTPHMWTPVGGPFVTMSIHLARPAIATH